MDHPDRCGRAYLEPVLDRANAIDPPGVEFRRLLVVETRDVTFERHDAVLGHRRDVTGEARNDPDAEDALQDLLDLRVGSFGRLELVDDVDDALDASAQPADLAAPGGVLDLARQRDDIVSDG